MMFEVLEEKFGYLRELNEYSRAVVTFTTATGSLFVVFFLIRLIWKSIQGFRLYVWSQICRQPSFVKRYGQWACISGATDGIGLAMAKELASRGHSIIIIGRNEEKLIRTKATLEEVPNVGQVETVKIDLSDSSLENFEKIRDQIGFETRDIGILINNAGCFPTELKRYGRFNLEEVRYIVNLNILATLYLTNMALPGMVCRGKGLILNVSSSISYVVGPYVNVYGATKVFVNQFSKQLQHEYKNHPIDIINLTPGAVHTKPFEEVSNFKGSGIINPSADKYARISLNAVSTRISSISGTIFHGLTIRVIELLNLVDGVPYIYEKVARYKMKNLTLSPVPKRKRLSQ